MHSGGRLPEGKPYKSEKKKKKKKKKIISRGGLYLPYAICASIVSIYPIWIEVYLEPSQTPLMNLSAKIVGRF